MNIDKDNSPPASDSKIKLNRYLNNEKIFYPYALCPKCYQIPSLQIINTEAKENLEIKCNFCCYNETININNYLEKMRIHYFPIPITCQLGKSHQNKKSELYCPRCDKWMCEECYIQHKVIFQCHSVKKLNFMNEVKCPLHKKNDVVWYCFKKDKYYCNDCLPNIEVTETCMNLDELKKSIDKRTIINCIKQGIEAMNELKKFKGQIIDKLEKLKIELNEAYEKFEERNSNILMFVQFLTDNYDKLPCNYYAIINMLNNTKLDVKTNKILKKEFTLENILSLKRFFVTKYFHVPSIHEARLKTEIFLNCNRLNQIKYLKENKFAISANNVIKILDNITQTETQLNMHDCEITYFTQLENNKIVSGDIKGNIIIWKPLNDGYKGKLLKVYDKKINKIISLNNDLYATCAENIKVKILKSCNLKRSLIKEIIANNGNVRSILKLSNYNVLVTADNEYIMFWNIEDIDNPNFIVECKITCEYPDGMIEFDNKLIVAGNGKISIFHPREAKNQFKFEIDKDKYISYEYGLFMGGIEYMVPFISGIIICGNKSEYYVELNVNCDKNRRKQKIRLSYNYGILVRRHMLRHVWSLFEISEHQIGKVCNYKNCFALDILSF